jgi:predicted transcriptional regulator
MSDQTPPQAPPQAPPGAPPQAPGGAGTTTSPASLKVENIMISNVHSINADMTVRDAIRELLKFAIGGAPVIDSQKKVMTVISEGDLLRLAAAMGLEKTIFQCMLKLVKADKLITVLKTDSFADAYKKFLSHPVHRLIVIDEKGRLEGLVSRSTVLRVLADSAAATKAPPA